MPEARERTCIYCDGLITENVMNLDQIMMGKPRCKCPMAKKRGSSDTEVHWAKRRQSILAICSDPRPHTYESHIVALVADEEPADVPVTCLACIAAHHG